MRCGNCKNDHPTVADVKACYGGAVMVTKQNGEAITEKQLAFLRKLLAERPMWAEVMNYHDDVVVKMTKREASQVISQTLEQKPETGTAVASLPDVPAGHYAVKSLTGNNDFDFFRVDRPEDGKWKGRTFVHRVIGGHPDYSLRFPEAKAALEAIVTAGIETSAILYGREIGRCYKCNRHLTDELSRQMGIGPVCRGDA